MALVRLGNLAIEWDRVYLVETGHLDHNSENAPPGLITVYADLPHIAPGANAAQASGFFAADLWAKVTGDRTLKLYRAGDLKIAVDLSKVCAVHLEPPSVVFVFSRERTVTIPLDPDFAKAILDTIESPKKVAPLKVMSDG